MLRSPVVSAAGFALAAVLLAFAPIPSASAVDSIVVINEIHYHPEPSGDASAGSAGEFVELYNQNVSDVDLSGWSLTGGIEFDFPEGTILNGGAYLVVAEDPAALGDATGLTGVLGPFEGRISDAGEVVRLRNRNRRIMDEIEFGDRFPWPVAADGSGATLAKRDPATPSALPDFWTHSVEIGGTPGAVNFRPGGNPTGGDGNNVAFGKPVIDGSGAWNNLPFDGINSDGNSFRAQNVTDGSTSDVFGSSYWLGREGRLNEYFTLDLGRSYPIAEIRLRNTHNTQYNDRGTIDFRIYASDAVDASRLLVSPRLILSGRLTDVSGQDPIEADVFDAVNGLVETEARYLQFVVLSAKNNNAGLNEIEVYPPEGSDPGPGDPPPSVPIDLPLRINETAAAAARDAFWLELHNGGENARALEGFELVHESGGAFVFPAEASIPGGGRLVVSGEELGFDVSVGDRLFLYLPGRIGVLDAVALRDVPQGRMPDGEGDRFLATGAVGLPTPGEPNDYRPEDAIVINEIQYHGRPRYALPGTPPTFLTATLLDWGATWRYNESGIDPGSGWAAAVHSVGVDGWTSGPGPLGYETNSASQHVPIATVLTLPSSNDPYVLTYYFETEFEVSSDRVADVVQLRLTHQIDDGAVFFLNGHEIGRHGMPEGPVSAATPASRAGEAELLTLTAGTEFLLPGLNRLSVEVHQSGLGSSDVQMGVLLEAQEIADPGTPGTPFIEDGLEWIELHNRSTETVDVGGWTLDEAVDLRIPGGTLVPSGGYLVLTNDAAEFALRHPGIPVVGDWSGSLANGGERIRLDDALGNPADSVFYRDGTPWPGAADGGGSSLELLHPFADNAPPAAWAASDSASASEWRTYSFTGVAATPVYTPGLFNFHELRIGLLDDGEVLLDDVSVVEDPDGAARELIANGGFSSASGWRLLGTHRDSEVVDDGAGNSVLRLVAVDGMNYMNNLVECNLTSGGSLRPVQPGARYRITFRARWLSGSPQLRAELYYNRLAHTFILDQPGPTGTPGARNSTALDDIAPILADLEHAPAVPAPGTPVTVRVAASDPDGVASLTLRYSVNGGAFASAPMALDRGDALAGDWSGEIPGQSNNALVQFYVEARDSGGVGGVLTSRAPAAGPDSRALVRFATPTNTGVSQSIRLTMLPADANALHASHDILSNHRYGCTVVLDERIAIHDCGIRLRGSMFSRNNSGSTGLNIRFPSDRQYRGIHGTITTRRAGRREIVVKHMVNHAGGIHDNYNDIVHQFGHISAQNGRTRLEMARFGGEYLEGLPGGDGDEGTVFKMEGIREFQATRDGTPNSPKLPFPIGWISNFDIADQGEDKEIYRHNMRINSNFAEDDYDSIIRMCRTFSLSGQELQDAAPLAIDVDRWMRQFAMLSLCGIGDTYTQGNPHNLNFYVRPSDGLVEPMPWDWDFTFSLSTSASLWGGRNLGKIIARPVFTRLFHGHLLDIMQTTFNEEYMGRWLSHYSTLSSEGYTGDIGYIRQRAAHVRSRLPAEVPFRLTTNGGAAFSVDGPHAVLRGDGWINVREILGPGGVPLPVRWTDGDSWEVDVPLAPGPNAVTLTALDHQGAEVGSASVTVTNSGAVEPAAAHNLAITEIHYHPANDAPEEFVELLNISPTGAEIDLTGLSFTEGITFAFPDGTRLAPGARLVVVQDFAGFVARYGEGIPIVGAFADGTRLANGGEALVLARTGGSPLHALEYDDALPWPTSPDGDGPSLVLIAPKTNPDPSDPGNWRAGTIPGGTPGLPEPGENDGGFTGDPAADDDENGLSNFLDYALGNHLVPPSQTTLVPTAEFDSAGHLLVRFPRNAAAADAVLSAEISGDLTGWAPASAAQGIELEIASEADLADGRLLVTLRSLAPLDPASPWFVRLRADRR